ncbi:Soluble aldose sugar dehydrogenase YliI precursor [Aminobacter sp. MSH1]|uniref:PQQ-dependent sugar dehydrogenase n=1 Tax=Aminobacter sp. MSH1 TaxID=374606 RepID=UPI000D33D642|nr:PQQ-dependent sugar dehydrogenase [Aminobacter sp. MSH1]AWC23026.1 Soluble aldose sugar dehydrogenase YliI precursor [Aminobacter sp. MSH1]
MSNSTPLLAFMFALVGSPALAESQSYNTDNVTLRADVIADGLDHPWGLDFLPGNEAIITERSGNIRILSQDGLSAPVAGVPKVQVRGQGGLLDIAVARDFERSGTIFFSFSEPGRGGAGTALARAKLVREGAAARLEEVKVIFSMNRKSNAGQHFGSRIVVNDDGTLFVTTGDRGDGNRAQDMHDHAGAVIRINADGSVPADNPSPDGKVMAPEIWSKGHRNLQGATFDPVLGGLITVEHGAQGGDELNRPLAGRNYGWPVITYGRDYSGEKIGVGTSAKGYEQPLYYWDPSIAPSGLASYQGDMFPEWKGDLLVGSLKFELLSRLDRDAKGNVLDEERMLDGAFGRIRDVNVAPDGSVWLLTDESNGTIVRLSRGD